MIEKIIAVFIVALLYALMLPSLFRVGRNLLDAIDSTFAPKTETGCSTPEYRRPTLPPDCIDVAQLHAGLVLIPSETVTCGVCRFRDKQAPRMCNHSLGIDVAINPWDSCEYGEREVEA